MDLKIVIREIGNTEIFHLDYFLYEAIFMPEGQDKPDKEIIKLPVLSRYTKDFGKETDLCLVADLQGNLIGAIWTRIFGKDEKGFGYVDSKTPELSMSVNNNYRQQGIGTNLLTVMIDKLTKLDYKHVSLSVDKRNYAYKLYQKFGFEIVQSDEMSVTMIKQLKK